MVEEAFGRLSDDAAPQPAGPVGIGRLIDDGESDVLGFNASARWNLHTGDKDPRIEHVIVKTVAGFMNADGGVLLIGVADDGSPVGLQNDYAALSKSNRDGFELFLTQLIDTNLSGVAATLIRTAFEPVDGHEICRVTVAASANPSSPSPRLRG